jgi:hypothetical protein
VRVTARLARRQGYHVGYPCLHRNLTAADDPVTSRMILIDGSRRHFETNHPNMALDLYDSAVATAAGLLGRERVKLMAGA